MGYLDEYADVRTHWIALYNSNIEIIYFDSFGVEHVSKEVQKFIRHINNVWIFLHLILCLEVKL